MVQAYYRVLGMTDRMRRLVPSYCGGVTMEIDGVDLLYVCLPNTLEMERFPRRLRISIGEMDPQLHLMGWYMTNHRRWYKCV